MKGDCAESGRAKGVERGPMSDEPTERGADGARERQARDRASPHRHVEGPAWGIQTHPPPSTLHPPRAHPPSSILAFLLSAYSFLLRFRPFAFHHPSSIIHHPPSIPLGKVGGGQPSPNPAENVTPFANSPPGVDRHPEAPRGPHPQGPRARGRHTDPNVPRFTPRFCRFVCLSGSEVSGTSQELAAFHLAPWASIPPGVGRPDRVSRQAGTDSSSSRQRILTLHFPLSTLHSPLSTFHSPSTIHTAPAVQSA